MKAIVSVIGKDKKGIIAAVSGELSDMDVNIEDISQTILQDYFTMIMAVELQESKLSFTQICERLGALGDKIGVEIKMQSQEIFDAMHKIALSNKNI
ncbi:MAG: ACT domain-containing protein [Clostridia bacterium]|nr:ACT domain-containing protein [Clostridia bacterium]